jgi:hypothetical protein
MKQRKQADEQRYQLGLPNAQVRESDQLVHEKAMTPEIAETMRLIAETAQEIHQLTERYEKNDVAILQFEKEQRYRNIQQDRLLKIAIALLVIAILNQLWTQSRDISFTGAKR